MLEDHAADFIERSSPGHRVYGEHGAESIHKLFTAENILPSATSHNTSAEYPKKEHFRLEHPDAKALKPVILKRK